MSTNAEAESVRVELAFDGGTILSALVTVRARTSSSARDRGRRHGHARLDRRPATIALARVVYLKRYAREARVSSGSSARGTVRAVAETTQKGPPAAREIRQLVERGQRGDREALEELYLVHFDGSTATCT